MKVDEFVQIADWEATQLAKSRALTEELARESPVIFYDGSITLYHTDDYKDSRKLLLHFKIKVNHVT